MTFTKKLPAIERTYGKSDVTSMYIIRVSSANIYTMCGNGGSFMILDMVGGFYLTLEKVWIMAVNWLFCFVLSFNATICSFVTS